VERARARNYIRSWHHGVIERAWDPNVIRGEAQEPDTLTTKLSLLDDIRLN